MAPPPSLVGVCYSERNESAARSGYISSSSCGILDAMRISLDRLPTTPFRLPAGRATRGKQGVQRIVIDLYCAYGKKLVVSPSAKLRINSTEL